MLDDSHIAPHGSVWLGSGLAGARPGRADAASRTGGRRAKKPALARAFAEPRVILDDSDVALAGVAICSMTRISLRTARVRLGSGLAGAPQKNRSLIRADDDPLQSLPFGGGELGAILFFAAGWLRTRRQGTVASPQAARPRREPSYAPRSPARGGDRLCRTVIRLCPPRKTMDPGPRLFSQHNTEAGPPSLPSSPTLGDSLFGAAVVGPVRLEDSRRRARYSSRARGRAGEGGWALRGRSE